MEQYIMVEPNFKNTTSCEMILKGLKDTLRKKRISYIVVEDLADIESSSKSDFLFIISTSESHIAKIVRECQYKKIHPIVISLQPLNSIFGIYSSVTPNIEHSMLNVMSYLKNKGKKAPALYGISVNSAPDLARRHCFLQKQILLTGEDHIYYNKIGIDDCFENFYTNIDKYDSVICTNNYVAMHLVNNLKKRKYNVDDFTVIGCGKTLMATKFYPEIVFVYVVNENMGKTAVTVLEELQNTPDVLHINMSVKCELSSADDMLPESVVEDSLIFEESESDIFYEDKHIKNMLLLEKLVNICDATDMMILDLILEDYSYDEIANKTFLSQSTIKYRVKNMIQICNCNGKSQFVDFIKEYIKK